MTAPVCAGAIPIFATKKFKRGRHLTADPGKHLTTATYDLQRQCSLDEGSVNAGQFSCSMPMQNLENRLGNAYALANTLSRGASNPRAIAGLQSRQSSAVPALPLRKTQRLEEKR